MQLRYKNGVEIKSAGDTEGFVRAMRKALTAQPEGGSVMCAHDSMWHAYKVLDGVVLIQIEVKCMECDVELRHALTTRGDVSD